MYIYTTRYVSTVNEYLKAVDEGYCSIKYPPSIEKDLLAKLEQVMVSNDDYLFEYAKIISNKGEHKKAFKIFFELDKHGNVKGTNALGIGYNKGEGTTKDLGKSFECFTRAAKQGYAFGENGLAISYRFGDGVEENPEKAFYYYKKAAEKDLAIAQRGLGDCYYYGIGVEKSPELSFYWYKKSAEQGHARAQYYTGFAYEFGDGVEENPKEAAYWYKKAADQGLPEGQWSLAICYADGCGVEQSFERAFYWHKKAAKQGHAKAQWYLGLAYQSGKGVERSYEQAFYWFKKAAEQGYAPGQNMLGFYYGDGLFVEKDIEKSLYWFKKAEEQNDEEAQYQIGYFYREGIVLEQSHEKAFESFKKAAEQGHSLAQTNVGYYYETGQVVEQSYEEAFKWYKMAADNGDEEGQFHLGLFYEYGRGVEASPEQAFIYYKKAAEQDHEDAEWELGKCYHNGIGVKPDFKQAAHWFKKSAQQENACGYAYLGRCYLTGNGVKKSVEKGLLNLKKSMDLECVLGFILMAEAYEEGYGVERDLNEALRFINAAAVYGGDVNEDVERITRLIEEEKHSSSKIIPHDIDIFISWNHNDIECKEDVKKNLLLNNIKVWESDENCEGDLDKDIKYAINHAKGYIIILSSNALNSTYMPKEVQLIFDRLKEEDMSLSHIKIYTVGDYNEIVKGIEALDDGHSYQKLLKLCKDFSNDVSYTVLFAKEMVRRSIIINYQKSLNARFDVFPISLSETIIKQGNIDVAGSLEFERGYINRDLIDETGKRYSPSALLKLEDTVLIHGEGGSGKSLYLKNLIRNNNDETNVFFYLPCSAIKKEYLVNKDIDLISLISKICFSITEYHDIPLSIINDIFRNDKKRFRIVFDALDEADDIKDTIIKMVDTFKSLSVSGKISFLFTTRSAYDAQLIREITNQNVISLQLSHFSDKDAIKLFDAIYERNNFRNKTANKKLSREELNREYPLSTNESISRAAFISCLSTIAEDIKKNPLLISNLIYIYFATRELQTQRSYILEKSNDILINSLENERGTIVDRQRILKELNINLGELLEFIAFRISCDEQTTIEDAVRRYQLNRNGEEPNYDDVSALSRYLRNRRIIIGNHFSHNIYLSYFAARYIFKRIYQHVVDEDFDEDYLDFVPVKGLPNLNKYVETKFISNYGVWPSITLDFISKLDYEIHYIKDNRQEFNETKRSFPAFDTSLKILSKGIGDIAHKLLKDVTKNTNIFYYALLIKNYF